MGSKVTKIIVGAALIGASFLIPGLSPVVAGLLLNTGVGLVSRAVFSPKLDQRQNAIELNTANNLSPLPVVYGRAKVGLRLVDMRATGNDLWIVGALCHAGQSGLGVSAIKEVYFNDVLAFDAAGVLQDPFRIVDGVVVGTHAWFYPHRGEDSQTADINLKAAFPNDWTDNDKGVGVAYAVFHLKWNRDIYPNGIPNITCMVEGNQVFDPRDTLNKYSTNPALCLYDYLKSGRYGGAVTAFEVDEPSFSAAANYCDDLITTPQKPVLSWTISAATAATPCEVTTSVPHGYSTGDRVSIILGNNQASAGLTGLLGNWTITVTSPTKFTLNTSVTTGTYNVNSCKVGKLIQQKRFECNGWLDSEQSPMDNIQEILNSCRGNLVYEGGKFRFFIRQPTTAQTLELSEDNIIGGWNFSTQGIKESPNQVRVRFLNAAKNGAPDEVMWPRPGATNAYLTQDNNFESTLDVNLSMTTDRYTAEQIGMVILRESRSTITVELTSNEEGLLYRCGDVVKVTHPTPGWTSKSFWVMGTIVTSAAAVRLALMEYDVNAYTLDEQAMFPADPDTNFPNPLANGGPASGPVAAASTVIGTDGTVVNTITVTWTAPSASNNPNLDHYELQYKLSTESLWRPAPNPQKGDTQAIIAGVGVGTWNVQLKTVNSFGASSAWYQASVVISGGGGTGGSTPATPTGLAASFLSGNLEVKWNLNTEPDVARYEVREGASWAGGVFLDQVDAARFKLLKQYITKRSYTIRIKAVTRSGTYSATEASVTVSQPIPDATQITAPDVVVESRLGKIRMTVDLTATGATQARLFASLTNGFTPAIADAYAERSGLVNTTKAVFEFLLPVAWWNQTVYFKVGLKDELTDQLSESEQISSQFSVVGKRVIFSDITRGVGGQTGDVIVGKLTDLGELDRSQRLDGQGRTLIELYSDFGPNLEFDVWESASQPHGWTVDVTAGAVAAKDTTFKRSGESSLKYSNPDNASNAGWHGLSSNDPTVGQFCLPLQAGKSYLIKISSAASHVASGEQYRMLMYFKADLSLNDNKAFTYTAVNTWQDNEWKVTVPAGADPNSTLYVQFNRNGNASAVDFWVDKITIQEIEVQSYYDNGTKTSDFTIDWANGARQRVKVNSATGIAITMTNPTAGMFVVLVVEQGNNRPYRWNTSNISWMDSDGPPVTTLVPGHQDVYVFFYDSKDSKWRCAAFSGDHSDQDVRVMVGRCRLGANLNDTVSIQTDFVPKGGMFFWTDLTGTGNADRFGTANDFGWGAFSWDGSNLWQVGVGAHVQNGAGTSNVSTCQRHSAIVATIDDTNVVDGIGVVDSVNNVGLTLKTTDAFPANKNPFVNYIIFGGSTVQAQVGWFSITTGTGSKAVTGIGFKPNSVFLMGIGTTTTTDTVVQAMSPWFSGHPDGGFGSCHTIFAQDNVGTDNTRSGFSQLCAILHRNNSDVDDLIADISSHDTDGFTLNVTTNTLGASNQMFLCMKGVQMKTWTEWLNVETDEFRFEEFNMTPVAVLCVHGVHTPADQQALTVWKDHGHIGFGASVRSPRNGTPPGTSPENQGTKQWAQSVFINDSPASGNSECRQAKSVVSTIYKLATNTTATVSERVTVDRWEREGPVATPQAMTQALVVSRFLFGVP